MSTYNLTSRRDFVRCTLGAAALFGSAGRLSAKAPDASDYKALVCVFLYGGNDANNMVVPCETATYSQYQKVRQSLAIPQKSLLPIFDPATNSNFGLHPALHAIAGLYEQKRLAVMANVGTLVKTVPANAKGRPDLGTVPLPSNLYSHSDQQNEWQNAAPTGNALTGWSGRLADRILPGTAFPPAIGIGGSALQIAGAVQNPVALDVNGFSILGADDAAAMQALLRIPSKAALVQTAQSSLKSALDVANQISSRLKDSPALPVPFPKTALGQQLAQVAKVIQIHDGLGANRQIFFCSQGGFDTHSEQLRQQSELLAQLSEAIFAFDQNLSQLGYGDKVTTFTESEFSRTFQPNGNAGTDHAWGSHSLVIGGAVKGGRIYGKFPTLALEGPDDSGNRGNWVPTTSSDQYFGALAKWFGLQSSGYDYVFPNLKSFNYDLPEFI